LTLAEPRLRVAIDARSHAGASGGVQQFTLGLMLGLGHLSGAGEDYFALSYPDDRDWIAPAILGQVSLLDAHLPMDRRGALGGVRRRALTRLPWLRRVRAMARNALPVADALPDSDGTIERAGIDVAHFVRQAAFLTEVPSIYHPWDLQYLHLPQFFTDRERRWRDLSYRTFSSRAARVVAATTWAKNDFVQSFGLAPDRIIVIPVAPSPGAYPTPSAAETGHARAKFDLPSRFLVYPAQTWEHKNHLRLLEAVARVRDLRGESIDIVCTGHLNEHYAAIRGALGRLRLQERVRFAGYVSAAELQSIYQLATGMIFPSLFEGWGIPVVEAFVAGVPVASSNATSLPSLVGDAAILFDPHDVDQIADAALAIWTDAALRDRLVARGAARLARLNPDIVARTYRALYRQVAGRALSDDDRALLAAPPPV
jgi:glycosyltransferase involved in cell wall biosynthesis